MKTKEELNDLKEEVEKINKKLEELTEEELAYVTGGIPPFGLSEGSDHSEFDDFSHWNPMLGMEK